MGGYEINRAAVAIYRRLRAWDSKHTCPEEDPPYPGHVSNSADPIHCEIEQQYRAERAAYEVRRAACVACSKQAADEAKLLRALGIRLKPWQRGLMDLEDVVAALEEAA